MYRVITIRPVYSYHVLSVSDFSQAKWQKRRTGTAAWALPDVPGRFEVAVLAEVEGRPSLVLLL